MLEDKEYSNPQLESRLILSKLLDVDKSYLYAYGDKEVSKEIDDKFLELLTKRSKGYPFQYIFNEKKSVSRGFYPYDRSNPIELFETGGIEEEQILVDYIDELFIDLLDYCKDNKLQVIFLVYPYSGQAATQQKYNYMERKVSEYGFDYLDISDYLDEIALDVSVDFYDIDHLSLLGSDKVSDFIGGYIDARYDLPDNRSNAEYAEWNEDYTIWNIEMEQIRTKMQNNNK